MAASEPFDIALFATGFRPALEHFLPLLSLDDCGMPRLHGMESADVPGLYFLGLDKLRSFAAVIYAAFAMTP